MIELADTDQPPEVLRGHGDVVVNVAGNLLILGGEGGCHVVTIINIKQAIKSDQTVVLSKQ